MYVCTMCRSCARHSVLAGVDTRRLFSIFCQDPQLEPNFHLRWRRLALRNHLTILNWLSGWGSVLDELAEFDFDFVATTTPLTNATTLFPINKPPLPTANPTTARPPTRQLSDGWFQIVYVFVVSLFDSALMSVLTIRPAASDMVVAVVMVWSWWHSSLVAYGGNCWIFNELLLYTVWLFW